MKINQLTPDRVEYTKITATIADSPKRLWYIGKLPTQRQPTVAIIGSRKPTAYGREVAHSLAYDLAKREVIIASGLALGIDSVAHRAALEAGGTTIAILPCGLDRIYPASHRQLATDIVQHGGALITEYPPGATIYQSNFIARNRIVSGLSDGLLIIEAAAKSGTIHTAGFALDQGRAVMAVPGNITSPTSEGCNNLIKTGARLVTQVSDILDELGLADLNTQTALPLGDTPQQQAILQLLHQGLRDGDTIQKQSGFEPAQFNQTMTMLEISGKIRALGGNQWGINR